MINFKWNKTDVCHTASVGGIEVGTVQLCNNDRYFITFLRAGAWCTVFQSEANLKTAKRKTEEYYLQHRENKNEQKLQTN